MHRRLHGMRVHMCLGGLGTTGLVALVYAFPRHAWGRGSTPPLCVFPLFCFGVFLVCVCFQKKKEMGGLIFSRPVPEGWGPLHASVCPHRAMMSGASPYITP